MHNINGRVAQRFRSATCHLACTTRNISHQQDRPVSALVFQPILSVRPTSRVRAAVASAMGFANPFRMRCCEKQALSNCSCSHSDLVAEEYVLNKTRAHTHKEPHNGNTVSMQPQSTDPTYSLTHTHTHIHTHTRARRYKRSYCKIFGPLPVQLIFAKRNGTQWSWTWFVGGVVAALERMHIT